MLIFQLHESPFVFFSVVLAVVISIVLHELAHGWAAIRRGDDTPIYLNRMTGNPLVHMGPFSLIALFVVGIAWGQMPVDRSRLRGRYAEAFVSAAGPAMNLLLAFVALTALGVFLGLAVSGEADATQENIINFLFIFGTRNIILCVFNLSPVPPLDGSGILANFNRDYAHFISDHTKQPIFFFGFILTFIVMQQLFAPIYAAAQWYVSFITRLVV